MTAPDGLVALDESRRARNRRTGWILFTLALVFFAGVFARYWLLGR
jgi:hypothetical protein